MNDRDFEKIMKEFDKFHEEIKTWTKEQARAWLVSTGIYNPDGTLREDYR